MKKNYLMYASALVLLTSCGGSSESPGSTDSTTTEAPAETIQYGPLKTKEEFQAETVYKTMEEVNAVSDKSTVIRFVSSEYNKPFPTEILDAHNLQVLALTSMKGELPAEISKLKNLTNLVIAGGDLTSLPESLSECQNLKVVSFESCTSLDLSQAIEVLKKCPNLQYLNLSYMYATELPASIGDLTGLTHLRITNNKFTSLPESLYSLQNLTELRIGSSEVTMDYADVLAKAKSMPALTTLWLQYCNFSSLPSVLNEYPALTTVHWSETWEGKNSDQIVAICEKENKKFPKLEITWNTMSGMFYDIY